MTTVANVEALTHAYGREIFARAESHDGIVPFGPEWWDARLMELTMGDPALRVQLFRFIDALPLLTSPEQINRHLGEYLGEAGTHLPPWVRRLLPWLPADDGLFGRLLAKSARSHAERFARRFIAGTNIQEALQTIARLRRQTLAFTVDLLGEATITEPEAARCEREYLDLIAGLTQAVNASPAIDQIDRDHRGPIPRVNVSAKLSALYSQFDPLDAEGTSRAVRGRLRTLFRAARRARAFVNIDMEQYSFKDLTIRIFEDVLAEEEFRDWPDVGIAIQAYLKDCEQDLAGLLRWAERRGTPVWIRLIKGAYWDYETVVSAQEGWPVPVFTRKPETDANYEKMADFLLRHHELLRPAFGSHNVRSLAHVMARAEELGLPVNSYEIQMLYGMAPPLQRALVSLGRRVRVYTPYGQLLPGMAYLVRRLLENTSNESFLRARFTEHVAEEALLMKPAAISDQRSAVSQAEKNGTPPASFRNEPLTDFSREENRQAMARALAEVKGMWGRAYPLVIGGESVTAATQVDSINPSHLKQVLGKWSKADEGQARRAIESAKRAFPAWRDAPPEQRAEYLRKAAQVVRRRRFELAAWEVYECGKQWREADADVAETIDYLDYYALEMLRLAKGQHRDVPGEENAYFYEPRGIVIVIAPWNFPLAILAGMTSAALVTGNTVIMKPAEQSAIVGAKLMEVFQEIGLPPGVANFLPGVGEEIGPTLVNHPDVALIAFTGSRGVGLFINRQAVDMAPGQDHVKRVIAEMGGKNAIIIDEDADLDEAVRGVVQSTFGYQGQKCSACSRVIALQSIHDVFVNRLVEATASLKVAPAEDPGSSVGPLIDAAARKRVLDAIERGKSDAMLVHAGSVGDLQEEGHYVAPHIFGHVKPTSFLAQEEFFGPILAVLQADNLDQALEIANGTSYALTGGLYSRSPQHIARIKREFRVGNLYINRKITGALVDRQPFGGFKLSGIGSKAGGPDYLLQFVLPRTVTENTMRRGFAPPAEQ